MFISSRVVITRVSTCKAYIKAIAAKKTPPNKAASNPLLYLHIQSQNHSGRLRLDKSILSKE
jgi:hypothetical protein